MSASRILCAFSDWLKGQPYCLKRKYLITPGLCLVCRLHRPKIEPAKPADNSTSEVLP